MYAEVKEAVLFNVRRPRSESTKTRMKESAKNRPPVTDEARRNISIALSGKTSHLKGKTLPESHREKLRKNSSGRCWINDGKETKKIKKEDLQFWIDLSWRIGRR